MLAHELGHYKLHHVMKAMALSWAFTLAYCSCGASLPIDQPWFYQGLGVDRRSTAVALALFILVVRRFTFLLRRWSASTRASTSTRPTRYAAQRERRGPCPRAGEALPGQRRDADARPGAFGLLRLAPAGGDAHRPAEDCTSDLARKKCKPCEGGTKPFTADEVEGHAPRPEGLDDRERPADQGLPVRELLPDHGVRQRAGVDLAPRGPPSDLGVHYNKCKVEYGRTPSADCRRTTSSAPRSAERCNLVGTPLKRVFSSFNQTAVYHARNLLESRGHPGGGEERVPVFGYGRVAPWPSARRSCGSCRMRAKSARRRCCCRRRRPPTRLLSRACGEAPGRAIHPLLVLRRRSIGVT